MSLYTAEQMREYGEAVREAAVVYAGIPSIRDQALPPLPQQPARDVPVAWLFPEQGRVRAAVVVGAERPDERATWQPLYAHPSPPDEKMRERVREALGCLPYGPEGVKVLIRDLAALAGVGEVE